MTFGFPLLRELGHVHPHDEILYLSFDLWKNTVMVLYKLFYFNNRVKPSVYKGNINGHIIQSYLMHIYT